MKNDLPGSFKNYFWDVNFNSLSLKEDKSFILKRILPAKFLVLSVLKDIAVLDNMVLRAIMTMF